MTKLRTPSDTPPPSATGISIARPFTATRTASAPPSPTSSAPATSARTSGSLRKSGTTGTAKSRASCQKSLHDLRLEYLDLYLVHWPFPNHHPPGCDVSARNPHAKPYIHENYMRTWRQMESLVDMRPRSPHRHVQHDHPQDGPAPPRRAHPPRGQRNGAAPALPAAGVVRYLVAQRNPAHRLLAARLAGRPERDRTPEDTSPTEDPVIRDIARRLGVHPAVVCIMWAIQRGQTAIPFSTNPRNILANLRAAASPTAHRRDMRGDCRHRPQLPPHQRPGLSLEGRPRLGRPVGREWPNRKLGAAQLKPRAKC